MPAEIVPAGRQQLPVDPVNAWLMEHKGTTNATYYDCQHRIRLAFVALRMIYPNIPFTWATLTRADVRLIIGYLEQSKSPATVAVTVDAMSSLYNYVLKEFPGMVKENPWKGQRFKRPQDATNERILSENEVKRLVLACPSLMTKTFLRFLYYTGCRASEAVEVTWRSVRHSDREGRYFCNVLGKGNKSRTVEIPGFVIQDMMRLAGKKKDNPDARLWPFSRQRAWGIVENAAARAGIKKNVSPHWMRHANASHALRRGANIADVQDSLGHARITTTQKYIHADPEVRTAQYLPEV